MGKMAENEKPILEKARREEKVKVRTQNANFVEK